MEVLLYNHLYLNEGVANILKDSMNSTLEIYPLARNEDPWLAESNEQYSGRFSSCYSATPKLDEMLFCKKVAQAESHIACILVREDTW